MKQKYPVIIDAYAHITPVKYMEALREISPQNYEGRIVHTPPLYDLEARFKIMDKFEGLVQVVSLGPVIKEITDAKKVIELSQIANDEIAEIVTRYPDRFAGGIASLPMIDIDAALKEANRAINDLRFRGVQVNSNEYGKPLDSPEFLPLYEKMARYKLPIFIHPQREADFPDYKTETVSKFNIHNIFGWPYETTVAMTRLVFSGILEKYPDLKVVAHHGGGMVPYYEQRIIQHTSKFEMITRKGRTEGGYEGQYLRGLTKAPIEYYKMFHFDTAIHGNTPALMCAYNFCGPEHLLLGADFPLGDRNFGVRSYRQTIRAIEAMDISEEDKRHIFEDNARKLMRLPV